MNLTLISIGIVCLLWIGISVFLFVKKKKSFVYILFFTLFYIYLVKVLDYTLFQFQSLLLLKMFMPNLMLRGEPVGKTMNLIPLVTLTLQDVQTSLLNILLFIPFGFGLPFITSFRMKKVVLSGAVVSVTIELLQFVSGRIANMTFRIADINDVIFNTLGGAIGYTLFVAVMRIYSFLSHSGKTSQNSGYRYRNN